jgi:ribosomal protein L37E
MQTLVVCVHCGYRKVSRSAPSCPNCGRDKFNPESYVICISCGKGVHQGDPSCNNCGETDFRGVTCGFCGGRILKREAIEGRVYGPQYDQGRDITYYYYHFGCVGRYFVPPAHLCCRDCGSPLPSLANENLLRNGVPTVPPCRKCGRPSPYPILRRRKDCSTCGLPVYSFQDKKYQRTLRKEQKTHPWRKAEQYSEAFAQHDFCASWRRGKLPGNGCLVLIGFIVLAWVVIDFIR